MSKLNLYKSLNADLVSSQLSDEQLRVLSAGNVFDDTTTITSASQVDIDFGKNVYIERASIRTLSSTSPSGLSFSASDDGITYTPLSSLSSTWKFISKSEGPVADDCQGQMRYSKYTKKVYILYYKFGSTDTGKLHEYDPATDTWSSFSLGVVIGGGCALEVHDEQPLAYFTPGPGGTSDWYEVNLETNVVTAKTPLPQAVGGGTTNGGFSGTLELAFDSLRKFVYAYAVSPNAFFAVYDTVNESWQTLTNQASGFSSIVYHPKIDKVVKLDLSSRDVYTYNIYTNSWSFVETLSDPTTNFTAGLKRHLVYSAKHNLIFCNTTRANSTNQVNRIHAYDITGEKFTDWKLVVQDSNYTPTVNWLSDPCMMAYNEDDDILYNYYGYAGVGEQNAAAVFTDKDLFSHYVDVSTGPYRYFRMNISGGTVSEFNVYGNSTAITLDDDSVDYSGVNLGSTGTEATYSFVNDAGELAVDSNVFIEPDGSEGSRYTEVSTSGIEWFSHCQYNDLDNFNCLAKNLNYNSSSCGFRCTQSNGGSLATDGYTPNYANTGALFNGASKDFHVRSNVPFGSENKDRNVKIGVEILLND